MNDLIQPNRFQEKVLLQTISPDNTVAAYQVDLSPYSGRFDDILITVEDLQGSLVSSIYFEMSDDGGTTWRNFKFLGNVYAYWLFGGISNGANQYQQGWCIIHRWEAGIGKTWIEQAYANRNSATTVNSQTDYNQQQDSGGVLDTLRITTVSGVFASGLIKIYGMNYNG